MGVIKGNGRPPCTEMLKIITKGMERNVITKTKNGANDINNEV